MKYIEKKSLDELIRLTRKYNATGDVDILSAKCRNAEDLSKQAFGKDLHWLDFSDFIKGLIGLNAKASNLDIYGMLERLGYYLPETIGVEEAKAEETA